jgi:hypothetical protein
MQFAAFVGRRSLSNLLHFETSRTEGGRGDRCTLDRSGNRIPRNKK